MTPEAKVKQEIQTYLKALGVFHWTNVAARVPGNRGRMKKGVTDLLGCFKGKLLAIEVKAPTGKVSDEQMEFIYAVRSNGGIAFVARSVDDVKKHLEAA